MPKCQNEASKRCKKGSLMGILYCSCERKYCDEHLINGCCPNCKTKRKVGTVFELILLISIILAVVIPLTKGDSVEETGEIEPIFDNDVNRFLGNMSNLVVVDLGTSSCLPDENEVVTKQRILSGPECAKACQIDRIWWATYYPTNKVCYCERKDMRLGELDRCTVEEFSDTLEHYKSCDYTDPWCDAYTGYIYDIIDEDKLTNGEYVTTDDEKYAYVVVNDGDCLDTSEISAGRFGSGLECIKFCDNTFGKYMASYNGNCYCEEKAWTARRHDESSSKLSGIENGK
jgi:hypothetical protein